MTAIIIASAWFGGSVGFVLGAWWRGTLIRYDEAEYDRETEQ